MRLLLAALLLCLSLQQPAMAQKAPSVSDSDVLFQISTLDALLAGDYAGSATLGSLKERGDFGLGTFHDLAGEMIVLDGVVYQALANGTVALPDDKMTTPFAAVSFFDAELPVTLGEITSQEELEHELKAALPNPNAFYAIKLQGLFSHVTFRSVPAQSAPYRPLAEVVKEQTVFKAANVFGVLVGWYCPPYAKGLNAAGFHLHFLSNDRSQGGHVLNLQASGLGGRLDETLAWDIRLPQSATFRELDLSKDRGDAAKAVEKR